MRGLLAIILAGAAEILRCLSALTLFPSRWLADGAEWCSKRAAALDSTTQPSKPGETHE